MNRASSRNCGKLGHVCFVLTLNQKVWKLMTLLMPLLQLYFNTSHSIRSFLWFCWFSGGQRLGFVAVFWWNAQKVVYMSVSYFSVSSVFPFESVWIKKHLFFLVFILETRLGANFHRDVFRSAFVQNFAMSLFRPGTSCKPGFYTTVVVVDVRRTVLPLNSFLERFVSFVRASTRMRVQTRI